MIGLIGSSGVVGNVLKKDMHVDFEFNSSNIHTISEYEFDLIICAAPNSNRLLANSRPEQDLDNIKQLISHLDNSDTAQIVLISTVDTQIKETPYATNRKLLEDSISEMCDHRIIRLCSLVGQTIQKNVLYDLKTNNYIDNINLYDRCQWYPLINLSRDVQLAIDNKHYTANLVSEPILNYEIVERFAQPRMKLMKNEKHNDYDLRYINGNYLYNKNDIFVEMEKYFD